MKKGDKLLCKYNYWDNDTLHFKKGKSYKITKVDNRSDEDRHYTYVHFTDETGDDFWFLVEEHPQALFGYFYDNKVLRKMKLERINKNEKK